MVKGRKISTRPSGWLPEFWLTLTLPKNIITRVKILHALELMNSIFQPKQPKVPSFNCFVKQDQDRKIHRKEIAGRMNALIRAAFPKTARLPSGRT